MTNTILEVIITKVLEYFYCSSHFVAGKTLLLVQNGQAANQINPPRVARQAVRLRSQSDGLDRERCSQRRQTEPQRLIPGEDNQGASVGENTLQHSQDAE